MSSQKKSFDENRSDILKEMHVFRANEDGNDLGYLQGDFCNPTCSSRSFRRVSSQYIPNRGFEKYSNALKHLAPFRRKKKTRDILGIDEAGFFSLITFSWMSNYIYRTYKKGLTLDDLPLCSQFDSCDLNAQRLESLWEKELMTKGQNKASFGIAVWKFLRTRILLGCFIFSLSCFMGFLSPTIFMRKLLEYLEDPEESQMYGVGWALALTCSEVLRTMFFALYYCIGYRTALRLRSACLAMVYRKLLRLNCSGNSKTGELINMYGFDGPRLYYMAIFGPMAVGGPILSICGFLYIFYILGPWALLGMLIFISYYPTQYLLSLLTGYYRQKAVGQSDNRIKIVTEILTSIKFIKMYGWENWFSSRVEEVRKKELTELKKISYCQSVGISLAPTVPVISGIATFLIHVATGGNLAASQAFSILAFLTKQMKMSIQVIRDGSLSFYEGIVSVQRFKAYSVLLILSTQLRTALLNMRYGSENFVQGRIICSRFQLKEHDVFVFFSLLQLFCTYLLHFISVGGVGFLAETRKKVLMLEENFVRIPQPRDKSLALVIKGGHFVWNADHWEVGKEEEEKKRLVGGKGGGLEVLHGIDLSVAKGALIGVCGPVAAGKSSLILACLGQVKMSSGEMSRAGTCAYVSQQPWMENASFKDNILFGEAFDPKKYIKVLHACVLNEDVNLLPGGDETEVGERGVNLSGGQKQRVALARALYADRDIYLLDDPFSALDPQVAAQVFEKYVMESLAGKTVLFVTRHIQFLQKCEEVLVMKEGRIVERGTYSHLATRGKEFEFMMGLVSPQKEKKLGKSEEESETRTTGKEGKSEDGKLGLGKLTQAEEQIHGAVRSFAFRSYVEAAGGLIPCFFVVLIILINVGSNVLSSWWLAVWIRAGSGNTTIIDPATNQTIISRNINDNSDLPFYARTYGSIVALIVATFIVRGFIYTKVTIRASKILHKNLYEKILKSPISYFERTPIGQIQNLFSRDTDEVDSKLPETLETMLQNIWAIMFSFLSIVLVFPWFLIPLLGLACLYYFISKIFRVAMRDMKRIENISRAPVFGAVSNTVQGLSTIHAFEKENEFNSQFSKLIDENATAIYLSSNAMRWVAVRLDSISVVITFITSLSVALLKNDVSPAFAGLALTYAAQICGVFQYTIRLIAENEARFISVERIQKNIETLESEGNSQPEVKVPSSWPFDGAIKFHKATLSYGPQFPDVLKGVSFAIAKREKIGVVGRTGAGKSSIVSALLRLVELTSGSILIDGLNIARVPLPVLRSRLSVIPQDPVLFSDTLRSNLDPFAIYDDTQLWDVLKKTKLAGKVQSMPKQMLTPVGEGESLSVGEKQLLCLTRVLLRGSKILILDEATASIDPETEKAVQTTIQEEFKECTIIFIAHRLSTVINCDRIIVVDQGTVLEFDNPKVLLEKPGSQFAKMWAAAEVQ